MGRRSVEERVLDFMTLGFAGRFFCGHEVDGNKPVGEFAEHVAALLGQREGQRRGPLPYLRYKAVMDGATCEKCGRLDGRIWRKDDPIWDEIYPPNGPGCRCRVEGVAWHEVDRSSRWPVEYSVKYVERLERKMRGKRYFCSSTSRSRNRDMMGHAAGHDRRAKYVAFLSKDSDIGDRYPYWKYVSANDEDTCEDCLKLHGRVWMKKDPIWKGIFPPNGLHCRCYVQGMSERMLQNEGLEVEYSEAFASSLEIPSDQKLYEEAHRTLSLALTDSGTAACPVAAPAPKTSRLASGCAVVLVAIGGLLVLFMALAMLV
ncbi:MAG: minor capsid protein [Candidatus Hydrogenedens sp.]|nr:minor capsid protein [Candidatus Hydrogenedentota bacterium]NLF56556.1 minor capsid protein [Candidatus Hydrogenedens sp.]